MSVAVGVDMVYMTCVIAASKTETQFCEEKTANSLLTMKLHEFGPFDPASQC